MKPFPTSWLHKGRSGRAALSFNLALCYVGTGQYQPAIALLNELRSNGVSNANVENLLAQSLIGNRQPEEAFAAFERAARLTPEDEKLYLYIIESCMSHGYYDYGPQGCRDRLEAPAAFRVPGL